MAPVHAVLRAVAAESAASEVSVPLSKQNKTLVQQRQQQFMHAPAAGGEAGHGQKQQQQQHSGHEALEPEQLSVQAG